MCHRQPVPLGSLYAQSRPPVRRTSAQPEPPSPLPLRTLPPRFATRSFSDVRGPRFAAADVRPRPGDLLAALPRLLAVPGLPRAGDRDALRPRGAARPARLALADEADLGRRGPSPDDSSPAPDVLVRRTRDGERERSGIKFWSCELTLPACCLNECGGSTERRRCGGTLLMSGFTGATWCAAHTTADAARDELHCGDLVRRGLPAALCSPPGTRHSALYAPRGTMANKGNTFGARWAGCWRQGGAGSAQLKHNRGRSVVAPCPRETRTCRWPCRTQT